MGYVAVTFGLCVPHLGQNGDEICAPQLPQNEVFEFISAICGVVAACNSAVVGVIVRAVGWFGVGIEAGEPDVEGNSTLPPKPPFELRSCCFCCCGRGKFVGVSLRRRRCLR